MIENRILSKFIALLLVIIYICYNSKKIDNLFSNNKYINIENIPIYGPNIKRLKYRNNQIIKKIKNLENQIGFYNNNLISYDQLMLNNIYQLSDNYDINVGIDINHTKYYDKLLNNDIGTNGIVIGKCYNVGNDDNNQITIYKNMDIIIGKYDYVNNKIEYFFNNVILTDLKVKIYLNDEYDLPVVKTVNFNIEILDLSNYIQNYLNFNNITYNDLFKNTSYLTLRCIT